MPLDEEGGDDGGDDDGNDDNEAAAGGAPVEVEGRRGGGEAEEGMRKVEVEKREKERGRLNAVPIEEKSSEMRFALVFERCRLF